MPDRPPPNGVWRRSSRPLWLVSVVLVQLTILVVLLEIGAPLVHLYLFDKPFSRDALLADLAVGDGSTTGTPRTQGEAGDAADPTAQQLLHPYVGYVRESVEGEPTNVFGYLGRQPVLKRRPGHVNVVLLGGSVALHMYRNAADVLKRALGQGEAFSGEQIDLVTLALPGYKQPQQLLALTYMLYLGAQYDVVINLDGFNEIALPFGENLPAGTYHHHPRLWHTYANAQPTPEATVLAAQMIELRGHQAELRERFGAPWLRWSGLALVVWKALDRDAEMRIRELDAVYRVAAAGDPRPLGPRRTYGEDYGPYFEEAARSWMRASRAIRGLGRSHGFAYFHFLQPNQYVPGSKPLSPREMRIAHVDGYPGVTSPFDHAYKWTAETGYPYLRAGGRHLRAQGVNFVDLTMIFEGVRRTLYNDLCCHLNAEGYRRLARRIGREIAKHSVARPKPAAEGSRPRMNRSSRENGSSSDPPRRTD